MYSFSPGKHITFFSLVYIKIHYIAEINEQFVCKLESFANKGMSGLDVIKIGIGKAMHVEIFMP